MGQTVRVSVRTVSVGSGAGDVLASEPAQAEIVTDDKASRITRRSLDCGVRIGSSPGLRCAAGLCPGDGGQLAASELVEFTLAIGEGASRGIVANGQVADLGAAAGRRAPKRRRRGRLLQGLVAGLGGPAGLQLGEDSGGAPLPGRARQLAGRNRLTIGQALGPDVLMLDPAGQEEGGGEGGEAASKFPGHGQSHAAARPV